MSVAAYKIFEENYSFKNKGQEAYPLSAYSLMCWREAFVWGYDWQQKEIDRIENKQKIDFGNIFLELDKIDNQTFTSEHRGLMIVNLKSKVKELLGKTK